MKTRKSTGQELVATVLLISGANGNLKRGRWEVYNLFNKLPSLQMPILIPGSQGTAPAPLPLKTQGNSLEIATHS